MRGAGEFGGIPPVEVKVTILKDRGKDQRSTFCAGLRRWKIMKKNSGAFLVGFLPSSGAIRRICYALVAPPGGQVTN